MRSGEIKSYISQNKDVLMSGMHGPESGAQTLYYADVHVVRDTIASTIGQFTQDIVFDI